MNRDNIIILASASPRRKILLVSLLKNFDLKIKIIPSGIEEILPASSNNPGHLACCLANEKVNIVAESENGIIIGADTIVVYNNRILGKPSTAKDAKRMLRALSGNYHDVYTGIYIVNTKNSRTYSDFEKTRVKFRKLSAGEIDYYIQTRSPFDKAGAYGIQDDFGSTFITGIEGDFFNVVGMPIAKTYFGLKKIQRGLFVQKV